MSPLPSPLVRSSPGTITLNQWQFHFPKKILDLPTRTLSGTFLLAVLCLWIFPGSDHALAVDKAEILASMQTAFSADIAKLRRRLFTDLPTADQRIYDQIEFQVLLSDAPELAVARIEHRTMLVELSVGFLRGLTMMIDALAIEMQWQKPGLTPQYVKYVAGMLATNRQRAAKGESPLFIQSPYDFIHMTSADWERFSTDTQLIAARTGVYANSVAFVLAHEVAHHVLGHTHHPPANLPEGRQQEQAADNWAAHVLLQHQFSPVGGTIPLLFDFYLEENPATRQNDSHHPADLCRIRAMVFSFIHALPTFRQPLEASGQSMEGMRQQMGELLERIEAEIGESAITCESLP